MESETAKLKQYLKASSDRARRIEGWNWEVEPKRLGLPYPWSYIDRARQLLENAESALDIGTGGGEVLLNICQGFDLQVVATEAWAPNLPIAVQALSPISAHVIHANHNRIPFVPGSFDVILVRHGEFEAQECMRVLSKGGHLLTQQVANSNWKELRRYFPRIGDGVSFFDQYQSSLLSVGFELVYSRIHETAVSFADLADLVYAISATPWTIPNFDVDDDFEALIQLNVELCGPDGIVMTESRFILEAVKSVRGVP